MPTRRSNIGHKKRRVPTANILARARCIIAAAMAENDTIETLCTKVFPAAAEQIAGVRKLVSDTVKDHPDASTICLLASELATNAIRHSGSRFIAVTIDHTTSGLRLTVIDEGRTGFPCLHDDPPLDADGGRGLQIIDHTARRWGIIRRPGTATAVWFEHAAPPPTAPATHHHPPAGSDDPTVGADKTAATG